MPITSGAICMAGGTSEMQITRFCAASARHATSLLGLSPHGGGCHASRRVIRTAAASSVAAVQVMMTSMDTAGENKPLWGWRAITWVPEMVSVNLPILAFHGGGREMYMIAGR